MTKRNRLILTIFIAVFFSIIIEMFLYSMGDREDKKKEIRFIVYGTADKWESMKSGAESFDDDLYDIEIVYSPIDMGAEGQIELINQAIEDKVYGLAVIPYDKTVTDYFSFAKYDCNVAIADEGEDYKKVHFVYLDEYIIGKELGKSMEDDSISAENVLFMNGYKTISEHFVEGLISNPSFKDSKITYISYEDSPEYYKLLFDTPVFQNDYDLIITSDDDALAMLVDENKVHESKANIIGISDDSKSVYYLDNKMIDELVYLDDFSFGYILAGKIHNGNYQYDSATLFHIVNHDNMHEEKNERVLFPFVK